MNELFESILEETNKKNIHPTPVIGGVGLIKKLSRPPIDTQKFVPRIW